MFLRVLVFYLVTMVVSGGLNVLQDKAGPGPDLIQLVQFAPALAVGVMFLLFRRTTRVEARFTPAASVAGQSALIIGIVTGGHGRLGRRPCGRRARDPRLVERRAAVPLLGSWF